MHSWGDVDQYNEMIEELQTFISRVNESCADMVNGAKQCAEELDDVPSLKACKDLLKSVERYQEAIELARALITDLEEERDYIIHILTLSESEDAE